MSYAQVESYNMSRNIVQMIAGVNAIEVSKAVKDELISIEKKLSFRFADSEVSKINTYASIDFVEVSEETFNVVNKSIEYSKLTKGFFDITLAPLIDEWRVVSDCEEVLGEEKIKELKVLIGYNNLILDYKSRSIALMKNGPKIDLGGITKGYATDRAIEIYKRNNIKSAMINIGGNVAILGKKEDGEEWIVGIQNPYNQTGECVGALKGEDISVVTSGNYAGNINMDNKEYGHILNKVTGRPSENDIASVSIICKEGIKADALSTAIYAMGLNDGINFLKTLKDTHGIIITKDNEVYISFELKEKFYMFDKENFKCVYF